MKAFFDYFISWFVFCNNWYTKFIFMISEKKEAGSTNYQDSPHHEGTEQDIPPQGQPHSTNNSHSMSDMMQDSPEQKAGRGNRPDENNRPQNSGANNS